MAKVHIDILGDPTINTALLDVTHEEQALPREEKDDSVRNYYWPPDRRQLVIPTRGGSLLLHDMIAHLTDGDDKIQVTSIEDTYPPKDEEHPGYGANVNPKLLNAITHKGAYSETLAIIDLFQQSKRASDNDEKVYRVKEVLGNVQYGLEHRTSDQAELNKLLSKTLEAQSRIESDSNVRKIALVLDTGHGIRHWTKKTPGFDQLIRTLRKADVVIWQMQKPLFHGSAWDEFMCDEKSAQKTICVARESDLRDAGYNLHQEGSIERAVSEFVTKFLDHPAVGKKEDVVKKLPANLIVTFAPVGCFYYTSGGDLSIFRQCQSAYEIENKSPDDYGRVFGRTLCTTALLTHLIANSLKRNRRKRPRQRLLNRKIIQSIAVAMECWDSQFAFGYGNQSNLWPADNTAPRSLTELNIENTFTPFKKPNNDESTEIDKPFTVGFLQTPKERIGSTPDSWTRLDWMFAAPEPGAQVNNFISAAREIVRQGLSKYQDSNEFLKDYKNEWLKSLGLEKVAFVDRLKPIPIDSVYGEIVTCNPTEIDNYSSLQSIVKSYLADPKRKTPLSLGVFGPPGSGKNFTLKGLLYSIHDEFRNNTLDFNLAQFTSTTDLVTALHQVQDKGLHGGMPLVVFDEFDSSHDNTDLGWLKYFLTPMEDGKFKHGDSIYQTGRAIFVFAGGTKQSFKELYAEPSSNDAEQMKTYRNAKVPDFVSRLRGHLDIPSISYVMKDENRTRLPLEEIRHAILRRAIILRSIIQREAGRIIHDNIAYIDDGVLNAFLLTDRYMHDVRSMKAIVQMSTISKNRFLKASLPNDVQLEMHVDATEFLNIVDGGEKTRAKQIAYANQSDDKKQS